MNEYIEINLRRSNRPLWITRQVPGGIVLGGNSTRRSGGGSRSRTMGSAGSMNASVEDGSIVLRGIIERLCFIAKIEEGVRQSRAGQVVPHEEVKKRFLA